MRVLSLNVAKARKMLVSVWLVLLLSREIERNQTVPGIDREVR